MPSELSEAITSDQWERVIQLSNVKPNAAKTWSNRHGLFEGIKDANVLPIHEALVAGAPYPSIEALLLAYPDSVYCKESSYKRLPLHCACRKNAIIQVVDLLLKNYADASLTADNLGRLPSKSAELSRSPFLLSTLTLICLFLLLVHYALSNGANDELIDMLLKYSPNSARGFDKRGWTP
jgi:ankyrin repeat protein